MHGENMGTHGYKRLLHYLNANNILPNEQSGFHKNRSTIDHLTRLSDDIHKSLFANKRVIAVLLDFNKAFDRLDLAILIQKLQSLYITDNIYRYILNFLINHTAAIKINKHINTTFNLYTGSP